MNDGERIADFKTSVMDIGNKSESIGNIFKEEEFVEEVLRSLPTSCDVNVTTMEENTEMKSPTLKLFEAKLNKRKNSALS